MSNTRTATTNWHLEGSTLTVRIPMKLQRRSGRKRIVAPDNGNEWALQPTTPSSALIRALGRAHRWQRLLGEGTYATINELCRAEKITDSYVSRILQLTILAPDIVENVLSGKTGSELSLDRVGSVPLLWGSQNEAFAATDS